MKEITKYKVGGVEFTCKENAQLLDNIIDARDGLQEKQDDLKDLLDSCECKELSEEFIQDIIQGKEVEGIDKDKTFYEQIPVKVYQCKCCGQNVMIDKEGNRTYGGHW